jgi:flagellar biosynthesis chaperone FliJ
MGEDSEMRKVSIRTVENTIGLARSVADGTTKFPFVGYCADLMEKMLEEIKEQQAEIEGLKMGFAGNGTSDSELAEVRAQANRWFLKIEAQQDYIDQLEKGLESSIEMNKAQAERFAELERKHKEEFDYAEKLLKERDK